MQIRLIVEKGSKTRSVHLMRGSNMIVGRQVGCQLRIPSAAVSRKHCQLTLANNSLTIRDLGSANGTQLNGKYIRRAEYVRSGDHLRIGPVILLVEFIEEPQRNVPFVLPEEDAIESVQMELLPNEEEIEPVPLEVLPDEEEIESVQMELLPDEGDATNDQPLGEAADSLEWDLPLELDSEWEIPGDER